MDEVEVDGSFYKMSDFDTRDYDFLCFVVFWFRLTLRAIFPKLNLDHRYCRSENTETFLKQSYE